MWVFNMEGDPPNVHLHTNVYMKQKPLLRQDATMNMLFLQGECDDSFIKCMSKSVT